MGIPDVGQQGALVVPPVHLLLRAGCQHKPAVQPPLCIFPAAEYLVMLIT